MIHHHHCNTCRRTVPQSPMTTLDLGPSLTVGVRHVWDGLAQRQSRPCADNTYRRYTFDDQCRNLEQLLEDIEGWSLR